MNAPFFIQAQMIAAVVMVENDTRTGTPVSWVHGARRAAARDLIEQLSNQPLIDRTILVSPEVGELADDPKVDFVQSQPGPIHVGNCLADVVQRFQPDRLLYFGGGSAPLLDDTALASVLSGLADSEEGIFTNNQFASDWIGVSPASIIGHWQERCPQDNMMGWVLSAEAGLPVQFQKPSAASRLDIDTPTDLLTLSLHPGSKRHLRQFLACLPLDTSRLESAIGILSMPASQVLIAGRLGPEPWQALNQVTRCWIRVLSEERGMLSSGRQSRGEVYSILADHMEVVGLQSFFHSLANQVQAAFIDTRVLLAHHGLWPPESDRFASDLGLVHEIAEPWLKTFSEFAYSSPIPIILGGHGLVSGDLFAICDLV